MPGFTNSQNNPAGKPKKLPTLKLPTLKLPQLGKFSNGSKPKKVSIGDLMGTPQ